MRRRALSIYAIYHLLAAAFDEIRRSYRANNYPLLFIHAHMEMDLSKYLTNEDETASPSPPAETTTATTKSKQKKKRMPVEISYAGQTNKQLDRNQVHTHIEQTTSESWHALLHKTITTISPVFLSEQGPIRKHV
jgi:hypothetical protein